MRTVLLATVSLFALTGVAVAAPTTISYTGAGTTYTAPTTGIYTITAFGAQGGNDGNDGGFGAAIGGQFNLTAGEVLDIVAGGIGRYGGGGGGSFVVTSVGNTPLVIAGGGGGGGFVSGGPGLTSQAGGSGTYQAAATGNGGTSGLGANLPFVPDEISVCTLFKAWFEEAHFAEVSYTLGTVVST